MTTRTRAGRLQGKVAVVTGAAMGIGRATAERFAQEGAKLVVTDINEAALASLTGSLQATGADALPVVGDVSIDADAQRMIQAAVDRFSRIDILIANAGIIPLSDVLESTGDAFDKVMAIDGRGMFLTCKYAITAMLESGGGSIVCTSSISGLAGQKRQAVYGPAKYVASGITKHLAIEWADRNIRVNAVAPGTIWTDRVQQVRDEPGGEDYITEIQRRHPMGRIGEPSEVAAAILFLASDDASFITGAILPVDGGYLAQ
ncbi:MAG: SDR family oxidoreductase [Chloroflexota bacterium]|nr:SDR family oxidoreductase [Chloroflexota bacterium]